GEWSLVSSISTRRLVTRNIRESRSKKNTHPFVNTCCCSKVKTRVAVSKRDSIIGVGASQRQTLFLITFAHMRILLTSDLHYKLRQYDWLIGAAARFDAVVIAGDHIDALLPVPSLVQIAALSASFDAVAQRSRLFVCSGNHDLNAWDGKGEKIADWLD